MIKFTCDRQTFYTAITHVAKGVSQKSTIPALERLKLRLDHDNLENPQFDENKLVFTCFKIKNASPNK